MVIRELLAQYQELPEYAGINLSDVNQHSLFGDRPIHVAATRGAIDELTALALAGADINAPGEHGYTALHDAVEQGKLEAVLWLLANGADRAMPNDAGQTPLQLAALLGEDEIESALGGEQGLGIKS